MSGPKLHGVKGMNDVLPPETAQWRALEQKAREWMRRFGYAEVRTPVLEDTALFVRGVGEATDIVGKEMYTFEDKGGRSVSLRPEGTAPAVRAYIEHAVANKEPVTRWFYFGPMFRYERMKTGRYRQFWQLGAEAYGAGDPAQDVEVIELAVRFLDELGLKSVSLQLNSLGDAACRPVYIEKLTAFLTERQSSLCAECQSRLTRNPLRVLDCKNPTCQEVVATAPTMLDGLCTDCRQHFVDVRRKLERLAIPYVVNPRMVRGLDYYTRTAFEFVADDPVLGTASAVGGGGRYDKLIGQLGGAETPAIGWAMGIERLCLLQGDALQAERPALFVAAAGDAARDEALALVSRLRRAGAWVEFDPRGGSLKSQLKRADKVGAWYALVLGEDELARGAATLKPMDGGEGRSVALATLSPDDLLG
ncbi:MAG: histidine--tRNA ligase [Myxococcaceae bacterium]